MAPLTLKLFVLGQTLPSRHAVAALEQLCRDLAGACRLEVIDVAADTDAAERYNILATPTLVREAPLPVKRIIGNLADRERLTAALDLDPDGG